MHINEDLVPCKQQTQFGHPRSLASAFVIRVFRKHNNKMNMHDFNILTLLHAKTKCADQPTHLHILISAFLILYPERTIVSPAASKILIFKLVSVAEQVGLSLTWQRKRNKCFLAPGQRLISQKRKCLPKLLYNNYNKHRATWPLGLKSFFRAHLN